MHLRIRFKDLRRTTLTITNSQSLTRIEKIIRIHCRALRWSKRRRRGGGGPKGQRCFLSNLLTRSTRRGTYSLSRLCPLKYNSPYYFQPRMGWLCNLRSFSMCLSSSLNTWCSKWWTCHRMWATSHLLKLKWWTSVKCKHLKSLWSLKSTHYLLKISVARSDQLIKSNNC